MAYEKELIINSDNFSVCINSMQINYPTLDNIITKMDFINPDDKVNVFLYLEIYLWLEMLNEKYIWLAVSLQRYYHQSSLIMQHTTNHFSGGIIFEQEFSYI